MQLAANFYILKSTPIFYMPKIYSYFVAKAVSSQLVIVSGYHIPFFCSHILKPG